MAWRETGRQPRVFGLDARSMFMLIVWILVPNMFTFSLCCISMLIFYAIERFGLTFSMAFRRLRTIFAGPKVFSRPEWKTDRRNFGK